MGTKRTQPVVFQPDVQRGLQHGINQLVDAIRPTLGPRARTVAVERTVRRYSPDLLDSGGVIARRIIQLPDRDADTGAMLLRQLLWALHEQVGDGTATAAVLFQAVYNGGARYIAAGGDPMRLRHQLEAGAQLIDSQLAGMIQPVGGKVELTQLAESLCCDHEMAALLGEIFDIIGAHGQLDIRSSRGRTLEREYVAGMYWPGASLSPALLRDLPTGQIRFEHAGVLICDLAIDDPSELVPLLELAVRQQIGALLIVAARISEAALGFLMANQHIIATAVAALPGTGSEAHMIALEDLALLTGGRPLLGGAGQRLRNIQPADLGRTRHAWADQHNFGISGGAGDANDRRAQLQRLRAAFAHSEDHTQRTQISGRIGRLLGGSATLRIGGATDLEITARTALAEQTARVLRGALLRGVLPGGGTALLACRNVLETRRNNASDANERAAYSVLCSAIEAPFRALVANAGHDPSAALAEVRHAGCGYGLDLRSDQVVPIAQAGVVDSAQVVCAAVARAISSAALALTIGVLIHPRTRATVTEP